MPSRRLLLLPIFLLASWVPHAFAQGTLPPGGSITIAVNSGAAILYGATVDNRTGDPGLQIARVAP